MRGPGMVVFALAPFLVAGAAAAGEHDEHGHAAEHHTPAAVVGHAEEEARQEEHGHGHDISQIKWIPAVGEAKEEAPQYPAYVWMVINFIVLVAILYFAGRKTVARFLKGRRDRLMANIDEASMLKQEAEERHVEYSDKLSRIKEEEAKIREELITAAVREKERLVADAGARAEKMRSEARTLVSRERAEAGLQLRRETADRAVEVSRQILTQRIGPGEHRKLVNEYMKLLESQVKS